MNKTELIASAKQFRKDADELLQRMKRHVVDIKQTEDGMMLDKSETIAQHIISFRELENVIMRQGLVLKHIGNPDPYPESRDPSSPVVAPTADGLKI